jgi:poly-beta-1,6-N-acetyl-D-glucosamine synthase
MAFRRPYHSDPLWRVAVRWAALIAISLTLVVLLCLYLNYLLHLPGPEWIAIRWLALGGFAVWLVGRPLLVCIAAFRYPKAPPRSVVRPMGVSVVIPCCNAATKIEETVRSVLWQDFRPIEIILVENNSTDDTWEVLTRLEREHREVRAFSVRTLADEYAASVAINYGVARATFEVIVRMDDDTVMSPRMVSRGVPAITPPDVAAVACNLRVANATHSLWTRLQSLEYLLAMELDRRCQVLMQSILCVSGGMGIFRRDMLMRSGGFCSLPRWVSEDMDMTLKAHRQGTIAVAPQAIGYTSVPETLRGLIRQRFRWAISGAVALYMHAGGVGNRRYWYDGRIGFIGLPVRALMQARDMLAFVYPYYVYLLWTNWGLTWVALLVGGRMAIMIVQLVILSRILHSRQGISYWWLVPFFVCLYGPILLVTRFLGAWAGMANVRRLRQKETHLEHAGLDPEFARARGLTLEEEWAGNEEVLLSQAT